MRTADVTRNTKETQIRVVVNLDGTGEAKLDSGIPFLDHMIDQIARHGMIDIELKATGDLHIDAHHTVEDIGITVGQAVTLVDGILDGAGPPHRQTLGGRAHEAARGHVDGGDRRGARARDGRPAEHRAHVGTLDVDRNGAGTTGAVKT